MSVLLSFTVLFVLILVHEWGHFIVAKKNGIRVDEFGIGFPPKLFSWRKGETEYTFNALPIGGFVKIYGENAEDAAADAAAGGDTSRSFVAKSKWVQAAVLIAGVTMNVLFAWFLYLIVFMVGVPTAISETEATADSRLVVSAVLEESPAARAGLPVGAEIISVVAGETQDDTLYPSTFSAFTETYEEIEVTYKLGSETLTTNVAPTTGLDEDNPDRAAIGVALALVDTKQYGLLAAIKEASVTTWSTLGAITVGLSTLIADSFMGRADFSAVAGPVGIVGMVGDAAQFGFTSLLLFTAVISLNLAVINLLPFPALDGGRLVFVGIEAVTRKTINPVWVARLNFVGFALLMLLMVAVTYNDILRLL